MDSHSSGFIKLAQAAQQQIKEISVHEVYSKIQSGEAFYLVDVRESEEWQQGHLPKAIHLSKGIIERDIEKHIPNQEAQLVLYCGGGFRSAIAAANLQKMGYSNIFSMADGIRGWLNAGYPCDFT